MRISTNGINFDRKSGQLTDGRRSRRLEPRAAAVLSCLLDSDGEVVSRQELLDTCWGPGEGSDEALTQAVAQVRRSLAELGKSASVETLAKRGYRMSVAVGSTTARGAAAVQSRAISVVIVGMLTVALLLAYLQPHRLRHFFRHNLGLGAPHSYQQQGS